MLITKKMCGRIRGCLLITRKDFVHLQSDKIAALSSSGVRTRNPENRAITRTESEKILLCRRWLKNLFRFYCAGSFPGGCMAQPPAIQGRNLVRLQMHKVCVLPINDF